MADKEIREAAKALNKRQKAFCDYYIISLNATEAAVKAGYSKKTAKVIGCENLTKPYIKNYIELRMAEFDKKRVADAEEVLETLTSIMRGEEKDQNGKKPYIADRIKAAELLGKRHRLFIDKQEIDAHVGTVTILNDIPREEDGD